MGQPETINPPKSPVTFLSVKAVGERVGLGRATIYRLIDSGEFPKPVQLSPKRVAWVEAEIVNWMNAKIEERDAK